MNYNRQIEEISNYFRNSEKEIEDFKIGIEFEHFVVYKDSLKTVSYYGENGVGETLSELEKNGWEGKYEGEYILELSKDNKTITLEPGSQLELSINAKKNIEDIEKEYLEFLEEIIPVLDKKNQGLITTAYHPNTKIEEIKLLPKKRYDLMFNYFKTKGKHAHNMMKGTAALQVSLDYKSEEDYKRKFRIANALSPVLYGLFDNGFYFEGERWNKYNLRTHIWNNCDDDRSGIVDNALEDDFSYKRYAEYILNRPPIFIFKGKDVIPTGEKKVKDIFNPEDYDREELEHLLTMFFPDVRTKKYIEIRMMDSVPYPLNFGAVALLKGIFYNEENLDKIYDYIKDISLEDIKKAKEDIIENGLNGKLKDRTVLEIGKWIVQLAKEGLNSDEVKYILPLEKIVNEGKNPYEITREKVEIGKKESLSWCLLNNLVEVKR
ncbi:glutamate--cysteine ligase [Tissierella sp. P1]|uniref:glutamate--cysteine ligase n=1 Tax=Tissierella TaxID=41273 RepID=UPI000BA18DD5|nr:glutamate-cysteine ligase family protein [Tissierella sp. P1]OZV11969.1 glutamate--cysteine ligase [Tissierella sp. P1]